MGDDYAKLAGLTSEEDLNETLFTSMKKRLPWLSVLLGLGICVSSVVGIFEAVVAQVAIIVCFQSLILDMAGNVVPDFQTVSDITEHSGYGKQGLRPADDGAESRNPAFCSET